MADANKVIEKMATMLGGVQRELAIALAELEETQEKLMALQIESAEEEDA